MAVSRVTSWADNTETQVYTGLCRIDGVEITKNPSQTVVNWVHLWNATNPDLAANDVPAISLLIVSPTVDNKYSQKYDLRGVVFDTALAWFVSEDSGDYGEAPDTIAPLAVRVFWTPN